MRRLWRGLRRGLRRRIGRVTNIVRIAIPIVVQSPIVVIVAAPVLAIVLVLLPVRYGIIFVVRAKPLYGIVIPDRILELAAFVVLGTKARVIVRPALELVVAALMYAVVLVPFVPHADGIFAYVEVGIVIPSTRFALGGRGRWVGRGGGAMAVCMEKVQQQV